MATDSRKRQRANDEGALYHDKKRDRWVGSVTVRWEPARDADGELILLPNGEPKQRQVRKSITARTKKAALERMKELTRATDEGYELARRDLTVGRFLDDWLANVLPAGKTRPSTQRSYEEIVRLYIKPHIGHHRLRDLQARDVTAMLIALEAAGKSANTRRLARATLRRALKFAQADGKVARNVAALTDGVEVGRSVGRTLTIDQAKQLLAAAEGERLAAAFAVALFLGLRIGELLALGWDDLVLDGDRPSVTVRRALKRVPRVGLEASAPKTAESVRRIILPSPVVAALKAHRSEQAAERLKLGPAWPAKPLGVDFVFRTPLGTPVDPENFRSLVYRLTSETFTPADERPKNRGDKWPTEYRWSPHELRHSAASIMLAAHVPIKVVSEVLGHSSIKLTSDVYGHLMDDATMVAADAMTAALGDAQES